MVDSPTKIYKDYVRANLPNGMSYDTGTNRYDINNHSFFSYNNSNWYYQYISKYGYSSLSTYAVNNFEPALVFDFKNAYFRKSATDSTFSSAMTHTASSNATMVDSDGFLKWRPHNNITKSNTFSTWLKNAIVVDNAVDGPTGIANTASTVNFTTTNSNLYNLSTVAVSAGDKVTLAAWVRSDTITSLTLSTNGRTNAANNTPETNVAVTSAWTLVTFEATVLGDDTGLYFIFGWTNTNGVNSQIGEFEIYGAHMYRSDLGGMVNNSEQPTGFGTYVPTTTTVVYGPRVGHHIYNGTAWVNEGILHESEARTNLQVHSGDFSNSAWGKNSVTVDTSYVAPDGTSTASKLTSTGAVGATGIYDAINTAAGKSLTCFMKAGSSGAYGWIEGIVGGVSSYAVFDLESGTVVNSRNCEASIQPVGNGWFRCVVANTTSSLSFFSVGGTDNVYPNSSPWSSTTLTLGKFIYAWGAQLEAGLTPSSYIPTGGATVTRAADLLTVPAANLPYDNTNMSIQMDGKMTYADSIISSEVEMYRWILDPSNYINSTVQTYAHKTGEPVFSQRQASSGLDSVAGSGSTYAPDTDVPFNLAVRHGSTFINAAIDGTALTANTTPTILPDLSVSDLTLGFDFMGTVGQFRMWSEDLTDAGIEEAST